MPAGPVSPSNFILPDEPCCIPTTFTEHNYNYPRRRMDIDWNRGQAGPQRGLFTVLPGTYVAFALDPYALVEQFLD